MAVQLKFVLTLMGLTGVYSIETIDKVPVKLGDSVTIPCIYEAKYKDYVKYLCKGKTIRTCSKKVQTNKPSSGKFSISDDRNQRIFTVTINNLTEEDTDYWCGVDIARGPDYVKYFQLLVTESMPSLYVDRQEITGFKGENITIRCHYDGTGKTQWCRLGGLCASRSRSFHGTRMNISKKDNDQVFNVITSGLTMESSGWYWCDNEELQMPVRLTVTEKPTTTTPEPVTLDTSCTSNATITVDDLKSSVNLKSLTISLSVLILIVMVCLVIWFILKNQKHPEASSLSTRTKNEEELIYTNIGMENKTPRKISYNERDTAVIYTTVVTTRQQRAPRVKADAENVIYSNLS